MVANQRNCRRGRRDSEVRAVQPVYRIVLNQQHLDLIQGIFGNPPQQT